MDDASVEPMVVPFNLLQKITNGFSEERELGSGSFGIVYLGMLQNGEKIAVKKLYEMPGLDDEQFQNEFKILSGLQHKNIVRLVGYCHDIEEVPINHEGKFVLAVKIHRALCLEYMSNGSLAKYISDECDRYGWHTGYRIIKGISKGLKYLHSEFEHPIYHLDLKPSNVLLDENMIPRIADFGISRLLGDERTRATKSVLGTMGYLPPEFINKRLISSKFDIFSLGVVIIKIMAGEAGYFKSAEMPPQEFTNLVQKHWANRLLRKPNLRNLRNAYAEQVKICIQIGLSCVQEDRHKRPTIQDIVHRLAKTETKCTFAARKDWLNFKESLSQQTTPSRNEPSSSYIMETNRNIFPKYAQYPNGRHAEQIYHGSTFNLHAQDTSVYNYIEENAGPMEARLDNDSPFCRKNNQEYSADGKQTDDPLAGIEGFHIAGDPRPGFTIRARGFPTNVTTVSNFQWVRFLEDGTKQPIKGATGHNYVVTADDVGTILALDCTPLDYNACQGDLVRVFANCEKKITCDPVLQNDINICISRGGANFNISVMTGCCPDRWEHAALVLTRTGYQINFRRTDELVVIDEKYSPTLQTIIPNGRTTLFDLVSSGGIHLTFNTQGTRVPNNVDNAVRQRDLIILVMRTFQSEALSAREETTTVYQMILGWLQSLLTTKFS